MRTTKIIVNPKYRHLEPFIQSLPKSFDHTGELIYNGRNQIRLYEFDQMKVAVKRYKIPIWVSRIDYSFFRPSKARRAYEYALRLDQMGFDTATPIAYIEIRNNGIFERGFFASEMIDAQVFRNSNEESPDEFRQLIREFAAYTSRLHEKGVLHLDFSPGNILYRKENDHFRFFLIDINRMRFDISDPKLLMRNFERISPDTELVRHFATEYASVSGKDVDQTVDTAVRMANSFFHKKQRKNRWKKLFK